MSRPKWLYLYAGKAVTAWTLGLGIAGAGCGGSRGEKVAPKLATSEPSDPCAWVEARAASLWNNKERESLDITIKIYEGRIAAADAEVAMARLDRIARDFVRFGRQSCLQRSERNELQTEAYAAERKCLLAVMDRARQLVQDLKAGVAEAIERLDPIHDEILRCTMPQEAETPIKQNPFDRPN